MCVGLDHARIVVSGAVIIVTFTVIHCVGYILINNFPAYDAAAGKRGTNFILSTIDHGTAVRCAVACNDMHNCVVFFYNKQSGSCTLHSRKLKDIVMVPDAYSICFKPNYDDVSSWIVSVTKFSSQTFYKAILIVGRPDVTPWLPKTKNPNQFVEAKISTDLYIERITICEMGRSAGFVTNISLLTPDNTWYSVWSTKRVKEVRAYRYMTPRLKRTFFRTSSIRIDLVRPDLEQIDAVKVTGKKTKKTSHGK